MSISAHGVYCRENQYDAGRMIYRGKGLSPLPLWYVCQSGRKRQMAIYQFNFFLN